VVLVNAYVASLAALDLTSATFGVGCSLSVIIGTLPGSSMLKEKFGFVRAVGAIMMIAGLGFVAID
jgi:hypothetical protein